MAKCMTIQNPKGKTHLELQTQGTSGCWSPKTVDRPNTDSHATGSLHDWLAGTAADSAEAPHSSEKIQHPVLSESLDSCGHPFAHFLFGDQESKTQNRINKHRMKFYCISTILLK